MTWLDLAKKHGREWVNEVLDLMGQLEDLGGDPVRVITEAIEK